MDTLIRFGGSVKALADGKIEGYLVRFSDATTPDLVGDYFTKGTDYDIADGETRSIYYSHGLDPQIKKQKIGKLTAKIDDVGVWVEGQLSLRTEYEKAVYDLAAKGKLGWSSGAPAHLVERKSIETKGAKVNEITQWPIAEGSLTPTPAEPRNDAIALKSLPAALGIAAPDADAEREAKTLPNGWTYTDFRAFLQDELQEDFGTESSYNLYGEYVAGCCPWLRTFDDEHVFYEMDRGELCRRSYSFAANDIAWGDDEVEVVARTVYDEVPGPDTDDEPGAGAPMMTAPKSLANATVKAQTLNAAILPAGVPFETALDSVLAAVESVIDRGRSISEMRVKQGRVMSKANHEKLKKLHTGLTTAHNLLGEHVTYLSSLVDETQPPVAKADTKKAADAAFVRFLALQARSNGVDISSPA